MTTTKASPQPITATTIIAADAVRVRMEEPVVVDRAPPAMRENGPYRMPKVFRLPGGELGLTFSIGADIYADQGRTSPAFISADEGLTWRPWSWPHPSLSGMNPVIMPVHDGEFWCLPAGTGLEFDLSRF